MNTYLSSSILFYNNKITTKLQETYGNIEIPVMMDWEDSLMSASAAYVKMKIIKTFHLVYPLGQKEVLK